MAAALSAVLGQIFETLQEKDNVNNIAAPLANITIGEKVYQIQLGFVSDPELFIKEGEVETNYDEPKKSLIIQP